MNNIHIIESKDNSKLKLLSSLKTKKGRQKSNLMLIEGLRAVKQLLDNDLNVDTIAFDSEVIEQNNAYKELYSKYQDKSIIIKKELFENVSDTVNSQGIVATGKIPTYNLEELVGLSPKRILLLDKIQDPGNAGTIIRTADSAGFDMIIYIKGTVDLFSPKVSRSSMGSNMYLPIIEASLEDLKNLQGKGYSIYATALDDKAIHYNKLKYSEKTIIALGNEANGIDEDLLEISNYKIYIPIYGKAESLNVGIAGAIVMYGSL